MKRTLLTILAFLVLALAGYPARGDDHSDADSQSGALFTPEELEDLAAPIALYPDPLLAQILPAATFIEQIDEAARYVGQYGSSARIDDQSWDVSVRAVAHYPDVLQMMDRKEDWTISLGQAYVNQPQDLMDAIQQLRREARREGNLISTQQQDVIENDEYIRIVPVEPEVIYVPQYDPQVVYVETPPPAYSFITFGVGFSIGAWLNRDCDWRERRVYYHGWRDEGWVGRARPYVHERRNVYINNNYSIVNVNRRIVRHDTTRYREDIRRSLETRRDRVIRPGPPTREPQPRLKGEIRSTPPPVSRAPQPATAATPAPRAPQSAPAAIQAPRGDTAHIYRGHEPRKGETPPQTGYGGYGNARDATSYRERGQTSRGNMLQNSGRQPVRPPAASAVRQAAPPAAPKSAPPSAPRKPAPAGRGGGELRQR